MLLEVGKKYADNRGCIWTCETILDSPDNYNRQAVIRSQDNIVQILGINGKSFHEIFQMVKEVTPRPFQVGDVTKNKRGHTVRIICVDRSDKLRPIVGLVDAFTNDLIETYTKDGRYWLTSSNLDLEPIYQ